MILNAFRLERDRHTESQSFGYERSLWPKDKRPFQHFTPSLGCPIEIDTTLTSDMVKMIEIYRHGDEPVVIERLSWKFGDDLYPYRTKYIRFTRKDYETDEPLIFMPNMNTIYRKLTGIDVHLASPLEFYLDRMVLDPNMPIGTRTYLYDLCSHIRGRIDGLSTQEIDPVTLREFLICVDNDNPSGCENFILPQLLIPDPISMTFMCRPLSGRNLQFAGAGCNPFDTSPVGPLQIEHPEMTVYSPPAFHCLSGVCDAITRHYSDIKIEYILSRDGQLLDCNPLRLVSRYLDSVSEEFVAHHCRWVAVDTFSIAKRDHPEWAEHQYAIIVNITYGDEALIEIYKPDHKTCLFAVHLDLAMLPLCAADVITQTT